MSGIYYMIMYINFLCLLLPQSFFILYFKMRLYVFLLLEFMSFLKFILGINPFYRACKYFLPFHRLSFDLLIISFAVQKEAFYFWYNPTYLFLLLLLCFRCHIKKIFAKTNVRELFSSRRFMV